MDVFFIWFIIVRKDYLLELDLHAGSGFVSQPWGVDSVIIRQPATCGFVNQDALCLCVERAAEHAVIPVNYVSHMYMN